jgi:hypothetical protein
MNHHRIVMDQLCDGYLCDCGWCGPISSVGDHAGEPFCPRPKCDTPFSLEPVMLCKQCHDEVAGDDGICVCCEQDEYRRDQQTENKLLLRAS